jgi:GPH family glycoside/pentoside/hexuronide:cation symporter
MGDRLHQVSYDKLTRLTRLAYGIGDFGPSMAGNVLMVFFLFFLTTSAGLPPNLAGTILLLSNVWSAVSTLVVGILSDRTQTPWGRRRIWMLFSAPILGVSFFLHWWVPSFNEWGRFGYYLIMALLFQTAGNTFSIPYSALITDITQNHHEHLRLNGIRFGFSLSGCMGSLLLAQLLNQWVSHPQRQLLELGMICGLITIGSICCCCLGTVEQRPIAAAATDNPRGKLRDLFYNRPLLFLMGIYALSWSSVQITPAILPYFVVNYLELEPGAIARIVLVMQGSALVSLWAWEPLSRRIGKKMVYWLGISLWTLAQFSLFTLHSNQAFVIYGFAVMAGLGMATAYLIPPSMVPEVITFDELKTGQRREGIVYSILVFLQKVTLAIGLFVVGQVLSWSGFQGAIPGPVQPLQPDSALIAIQMLTVLVPALALLVSLMLVYFYPINQNMHESSIIQLQQRTASNVAS